MSKDTDEENKLYSYQSERGKDKLVYWECPAEQASSWSNKAFKVPIPGDTELPACGQGHTQHTQRVYPHTHINTYNI